MAEIVGRTGTARVTDLYAAEDSNRTPAYAIYEGDEPARVALFNTNTDPSGGHTYTASINVPQTISSVQVKRLSANSVSQINNFTWAGQVRHTATRLLLCWYADRMFFLVDLGSCQLRSRRPTSR